MSAKPPPTTELPKAEEPKLSAAELKKRAKAEKQARRAAQKEQPGAESTTPAAANRVNGEVKDQKQDGNTKGGPSKSKAEKQPQQQTGPQKQSEQSSQDNKKQGSSQLTSMPVRRRPSQSGGAKAPMKKHNKQVELFSHLYVQPRRHTVDGVSKDVHPAVLALGFQISSYEICGSTARCVAMLLTFKEAIRSYTTPSGTSLARHLTTHYLSPQIDFLKSCRPLAESMGNAIRWLKKLIVEIDPNTAEHEAKNYLCENIDRFIQERITVTDQVIAASTSQQIKNGAVILTYAKSSIVEKTILQAKANGTKFRVIVVDSRPLLEGKTLATALMNAGLAVEYYPFSGMARAISAATLVLLGAHSMLSNGRLQSRIGTAPLAMAAHKADVPVIVCCESIKFSGKVALDSIVHNEVAPPEELLLPSLPPDPSNKEEDGESGKLKSLQDWYDIPNLQILNPLYDITPAEYIRMVICEYGNVPPSSVPVVHRLANEGI